MRMQRRQPPPLQRWQRLTVATTLVIALAISMALIVFQPGTRTFVQTTPTAPASTATDAPLYPPGTRYYYRRGQWIPLDQQEALPP
jgi:hypothetical protein